MNSAILAALEELSVARRAMADGATTINLDLVAERVIAEEQTLKNQQQQQRLRQAEMEAVRDELLPELQDLLDEIEEKVCHIS